MVSWEIVAAECVTLMELALYSNCYYLVAVCLAVIGALCLYTFRYCAIFHFLLVVNLQRRWVIRGAARPDSCNGLCDKSISSTLSRPAK